MIKFLNSFLLLIIVVILTVLFVSAPYMYQYALETTDYITAKSQYDSLKENYDAQMFYTSLLGYNRACEDNGGTPDICINLGTYSVNSLRQSNNINHFVMPKSARKAIFSSSSAFCLASRLSFVSTIF